MLKDLKCVKDGDGYEGEDGCWYESKLDYLCIGVLHTCGCGCPQDIAKYVRNMIRKYASINGERKEDPQYDDVATMFFLNWADHEGYLEHGTTIRFSWVTDKGLELLRDIDTVLMHEPEV